MSSKIPRNGVSLATRPLLPRQPSIRSKPTPPLELALSKPSSSKIKTAPPANGPKMSFKLLNAPQLHIDDKSVKPTLFRGPLSIKSTREALKKLSSNKPSCKGSRRPSEDIASENSNKNGSKPASRHGVLLELSKDKSTSNSRLTTAKPALIAQKLLALNLNSNVTSKQVGGQAMGLPGQKQNVFFEGRKPTVNFKCLVQQIRSQIAQNSTQGDERLTDNSQVKSIGTNNPVASTSSTLHAAIKARRLKTEAPSQFPKENVDMSGQAVNQRIGSAIGYNKRVLGSREDLMEIESDDVMDNGDDSHPQGRQLVCPEPVAQLKRRFNLDDEDDNSVDDQLRQRDDGDSFGSLRVFSPPKVRFDHSTFENTFTEETVHYLIQQEEVYAPHPDFLEHAQPNLRWKMRAILLDWMQEVCSDYLLKRETFYYAVNYVDRYLSVTPNVEKKNLQLVGLTALYLAAKVEEVLLPKVENMVLAANNTYTAGQITKMETQLYFSLEFRITPPTLNTWTNWYAAQWDAFVDGSPNAQDNVLLGSMELPIKFKLPTQTSYALYRHLMQILDATILDVQTLQYRQRALVLSTMYILLGREFQQFTTEVIVNDFPNSSGYLLDEAFAYNNLFGMYLQECFGVELPNLLPTIQFVATFFAADLDISLPIAAKIDKENVLQVGLLG